MARKLTQNVNLNGVLYPAGSTPSKEIADQITNPKAWGGDEVDSDEDNGTELPTTVEGLEAEIEKRNVDRTGDALIEVVGTGANGKVLKKDLVAALEADDAAASE